MLGVQILPMENPLVIEHTVAEVVFVGERLIRGQAGPRISTVDPGSPSSAACDRQGPGFLHFWAPAGNPHLDSSSARLRDAAAPSESGGSRFVLL